MNISNSSLIESDAAFPYDSQSNPNTSNLRGVRSCEAVLPNGTSLNILMPEVSLGRSRDCNIVTRNYPPESHLDFNNELKRLNLRLSSFHGSINYEAGRYI